MKDAADTVGTDPDDLSFIRSYRTIRRQVTNQAGFSPLDDSLPHSKKPPKKSPNDPIPHGATAPTQGSSKDTARTATASNEPPTTANSITTQQRSTSSRSHA
jgi:hypothetical protein